MSDSDVRVEVVKGRRAIRDFIDLPYRIYRNDPLWVPPLVPDLRRTIRHPAAKGFDPAVFLVASRKERPVARLAAGLEDRDQDGDAGSGRGAGHDLSHATCAHDRSSSGTPESAGTASAAERRGIFGFFEAEDDPQAVAALFRRLSAWARDYRIDHLDGPYDFDFEDGYGVLIAGFDEPPALLCGHNPRYYRRLLEAHAASTARDDAVAYRIDLGRRAADEARLHAIADRARSSRLRVRSIDPTHWGEEIAGLLPVLNEAQSDLPGYRPWSEEDLLAAAERLRTLADPDLILLVERNGRVVGWFPGIPDITPQLRALRGLRRPWHYARLWGLARARRRARLRGGGVVTESACGYTPRTGGKRCGEGDRAASGPVEQVSVKSLQVLPEERGRGAALVLFDEMFRRAREKGYRYIDLSLTGAENPYTNPLARRLGGVLYKRYRIYRLVTRDLQSSGTSDRN